jgi:hypothetical protein
MGVRSQVITTGPEDGSKQRVMILGGCWLQNGKWAGAQSGAAIAIATTQLRGMPPCNRASEDDTFGSPFWRPSPPYSRHPTRTALRCLTLATSWGVRKTSIATEDRLRCLWSEEPSLVNACPKTTRSVPRTRTLPVSQESVHDGRWQSQIASSVAPNGTSRLGHKRAPITGFAANISVSRQRITPTPGT